MLADAHVVESIVIPGVTAGVVVIHLGVLPVEFKPALKIDNVPGSSLADVVIIGGIVVAHVQFLDAPVLSFGLGRVILGHLQVLEVLCEVLAGLAHQPWGVGLNLVPFTRTTGQIVSEVGGLVEERVAFREAAQVGAGLTGVDLGLGLLDDAVDVVVILHV